jgi:hypothetical protein
MAYVLPDSVIHYEPPLERLHAPDTGTGGHMIVSSPPWRTCDMGGKASCGGPGG